MRSNAVAPSNPLSARASRRRVLVCLLPGFGDAIAASAMMRALNKRGYAVDVLTMLGAVAVYARALDIVSSVFEVPLLDSPLKAIPTLLHLRSTKYDEVYVPFPATRWQYAFVARLMAAGVLVMHDYGGLASILARAGRARLLPLQGGHRAAENLRLLEEDAADGVAYEMPVGWRRPQQPDLLGVHFGSMVYKNNEVRRWPLQNFVDVVGHELSSGRKVRLFVGPSERNDIAAFNAFAQDRRFEIIDAPLEHAAACVSECRVFLANDAGFAHLAAGLGCNTITLFGMTDPVRAQPIGASMALRPSSCPPCHDEGLRTFECVRGLAFRCSREDFRVQPVLEAVAAAFSRGLQEYVPLMSSDYRLYGRLHRGKSNGR